MNLTNYEVGEIIRVKLSGQSAMIVGIVYLKYDRAYMLRTSSLNQVILGEVEIEKLGPGPDQPEVLGGKPVRC